MRRIGIFSFFLLVTLVFTYPLSLDPASLAIDLGPDTRLFLWTLSWDANALASRPLGIFDANIFHPETRTLAYSEHLLGSALFAAPVLWTTESPVLAMNGVVLLSTFLSGLFAFVLARDLGLARGSALVAGLIYALSPPRFFRLGQLHLATVQWIPLSLALLHRYARGGSRRHLMGAAAVFTLQALSGGQSGLFLALAALGLLLYLWLFDELKPRGSIVRDFALAAALAFALNVPFVRPYLEVRRELGLARSLEEARSWSPNAVSYLASPTHVHRRLAGILPLPLEREAKAYLFPGILPVALALWALFSARSHPLLSRSPLSGAGRTQQLVDIGILALATAAVLIQAAGGITLPWLSASSGFRALAAAFALLALRLALFGRRPFAFVEVLRRAKDAIARFLGPRLGTAGGFYLFLVAFSFWASLGPDAGFYTALYRLVPGLDFLRVPSRFSVLTVLGLAMLAAIGVERLRFRGAAFLAGALLLIELAAFPLEARPYPVHVSPMDAALAGMESGALAVFPVPDPRNELQSARRHSLYMLHSAAHFLPMVNGYSGFTPPAHDALFRELAGFPTEEGLSRLEALSVRYAVFHRDGYGESDWKDLLARIEGFGGRLALRRSFEEGSIYEIVTRGPRDRESSGASRSRSSSALRASGP